jgi:N-acetylneuraminate synthase
MIQELKGRYALPVGFSDHSGDVFACMAAASLGAELLEFHVVFDKQMFGPDTKASLTIAQVKKLVQGVRQIEQALKHPINKADKQSYNSLKSIFEKSLAVNRNCQAGEVLSFEMLEAKKPKGKGISAHSFKDIIGRQLKFDKKAWDFLTDEDIL